MQFVPDLERNNIQGDNLERATTFTSLGATLTENGDLHEKMTYRIQSGWKKNWKRGQYCSKASDDVRCRYMDSGESTREEGGCCGN